jgi:RNA polymerase sigma-70 factor (ECF subfamily)
MRTPPPNEITPLLLRWSQGDEVAPSQLLPLVYQELHHLAQYYLRRERADHTLQPTALINEAYLRLVKQDFPEWQSRRHFYGVAAQLMRQILVEHARARAAGKRGAGQKFAFEEALTFSDERAAELVALDDALVALRRERREKIISRCGGHFPEKSVYFGRTSIDERGAKCGLKNT